MFDFDNLPLDLPPGIVKSRSPLDVRNRYIDCDKVRFDNGRPRKIGGWTSMTDTGLGAPGRGVCQWVDLDGAPLIAFGTYEAVYVWHDDTLEDITPAGFVAGNLDAVDYSSGWGEGGYGEGPWSGAGFSTVGPGNPLTWTLAPYGEDLLIMPRWGGLYIWDRSAAPGVATAVTNAPTVGLGCFVTENSRHPVVFGADGDGVLIKWASQETTTTWTATATNSAGDKRCDDGSVVIGHTTANGGDLLLTGGSAHFMRYIGRPLAFGITKVGDNCGLIAPHGAVSLNATAYWMGHEGFYTFDGTVRRLDCDLNDYVFTRLLRSERFKVCAGINAQYGEIWWHYPTIESGHKENEEYIVYNTRLNCWYNGTMGRSAWSEDHDVSSYPVAVDNDGNILIQEVGVDAGTDAMAYHLTTGEIDMVDGKMFSQVRQLVPDFQTIAGDHAVSFITRNYPQDPSPRTRGPYTINGSTRKRSVRVRSNSFRLHQSGDGLGGNFIGGLMRLMIKDRGERA